MPVKSGMALRRVDRRTREALSFQSNSKVQLVKKQGIEYNSKNFTFNLIILLNLL